MGSKPRLKMGRNWSSFRCHSGGGSMLRLLQRRSASQPSSAGFQGSIARISSPPSTTGQCPLLMRQLQHRRAADVLDGDDRRTERGLDACPLVLEHRRPRWVVVHYHDRSATVSLHANLPCAAYGRKKIISNNAIRLKPERTA